jgi:Ankyrin repeats (3 copies)
MQMRMVELFHEVPGRTDSLMKPRTRMQKCSYKVVTTLLGGIGAAPTCTVGDTRVAVATSDNSAPQIKLHLDDAPGGALSPLSALTQRQSAAMAYGPTSYGHVLSWHTLLNLAGATVVHVAAVSGHTQLLAQLVKGASKGLINQRTSMGFTAVAFAAEKGHAACVKALLAAKCDATAVTSAGQTLLHLAVKSGDLDVIKQVTALKAARKEWHEVRRCARSLGTSRRDCASDTRSMHKISVCHALTLA